MRSLRTLPAALGLAACWAAAQAADVGAGSLVQCQISLPKGQVYMRGATDPVPDLVVSLTLTNNTIAERRAKEDVVVREARFISAQQFQELTTVEMTREQLAEKLKLLTGALLTEKTVQMEPVNKDSLGVAYTPPALGPQDLVKFEVVKLPEEGQPAPEAGKVKLIERDMPVENTSPEDLAPSAYLAAGATSPEYLLPVGKFYLIRQPGRYSVKAILREFPDSQTPSGRVESNSLEFRVLPYKVVGQKIGGLMRHWQAFERGYPDFDYMFYQLPVSGPYDEIYYVQRFQARGADHWEWHRLCTVAPNATVQVAQVTPSKVALLAPHMKGDAGLYTVDFSKVDPIVTARTLPVAEGKVPTLVVEGGVVEAR
jgi:hypothetical protein